MEPRFRSLFNSQFTPQVYESYRRDLSERLGCAFEFRLAETPLFFPDDFRAAIVRAAEEIVAQLSDPARIELMKRAIPDRWNTPGMDRLPNFAQVDFAVVAKNGGFVPRLIELQGFPSLTAMEVVQCDAWVAALDRMHGLRGPWSCWFSGMDRGPFLDLARRAIVGDHDPAEVILMDLEPRHQKTYPDFSATKLLFGVDAADPRQLRKEGKKLYRGGVRIKRIYNRVVFDELIRNRVSLPFDYREPLDVEWAPHPNWYWVWSKYSLPFLDHPAVPKATLLSEIKDPEKRLERSVLKPLFSFAGGGVNVDPTVVDLERIPAEERQQWCLQEKIDYAPALQAPDGSVKVEVRMMFVRPDDAPKPVLAQNLVRLSRGRMLGVDFNKDFNWVGSTVGLQKIAS